MIERDRVTVALNSRPSAANQSRFQPGIRNRALITVLWRCGLRAGEALALEPKDIDPDAHTLRVRHGKGDKSRTVGLDDQAQALISRWVDRRHRLRINGRRRLFCKLDGGPIDQSYLRHLLRRVATKAAIDKRVHPHGLRHTYAAELAREGVPMNVLRDALGHTSLATTDRYLRDVAPVHVIETMRQREWTI